MVKNYMYYYVVSAPRNLVASAGGYSTQVVPENHGRLSFLTTDIFLLRA